MSDAWYQDRIEALQELTDDEAYECDNRARKLRELFVKVPTIEANDEGVTGKSLKFYRENKQKLGKLLSVSGMQGVAPDFYLRFENAIVHFTGLNCGYFGEGPRGLATILYEEGFFKTLQEAREYVASHQTIDLNRQVVGVR